MGFWGSWKIWGSSKRFCGSICDLWRDPQWCYRRQWWGSRDPSRRSMDVWWDKEPLRRFHDVPWIQIAEKRRGQQSDGSETLRNSLTVTYSWSQICLTDTPQWGSLSGLWNSAMFLPKCWATFSKMLLMFVLLHKGKLFSVRTEHEHTVKAIVASSLGNSAVTNCRPTVSRVHVTGGGTEQRVKALNNEGSQGSGTFQQTSRRDVLDNTLWWSWNKENSVIGSVFT